MSDPKLLVVEGLRDAFIRWVADNLQSNRHGTVYIVHHG